MRFSRFLRRAFGPAVSFAAPVLLAGCGLAPLRIEAPPRAVELAGTPFFAQTEFHCGPAALATVLGAQGIAITPGQIAPQVFVPGREGSLQAEMIAATRRHARLPLRVEPRPEALVAALHEGHPVLMLQNLAFRRWPAWHYAVLIGYEPEAQRFILRSGTERREVLGARRLMQTWDRAQRWAIVAVAPDTVPAFATTEHWLAAAAPFETLGRLDVAERAYRAAVTRWPQSALAWLALANLRHARGDRAGAETALREALRHDPRSAAARNNLANLLLERGCPAAARAQLDGIGGVPASLAAAVEDTRRLIAAAPALDGPGCR